MTVDYKLSEDVAILTLNRPNRFNAIEAGLAEAVIWRLSQAGDEARAVVLTGAGKAFCSGADLAAVSGYEEGREPDLGRLLDDVFHPLVTALLECPVPTIAAINGVAAGAGLGVALGCDLRVMAQSAFLTSAFSAIGLVPDSGTTWWLPQHLGISKALELALTNRRVDAAEARDLGLVLEVCPDQEVVSRAIETAADLANLVPDSLVTTRRLIRGAAASSLTDALAAERAEQDRLGRTPEHREGVMAFLEKRTPDFRDP